MTKGTTEATNGGIGFGGALALLFIGLKLGKVIDWPWIWVLSPIWIPLVIITLVISIAGLIYLIWK